MGKGLAVELGGTWGRLPLKAQRDRPVTDPLNATHRLQDAIDDEDVQLAAEAIRQGADVNALWEDQTLLSAVGCFP